MWNLAPDAKVLTPVPKKRSLPKLTLSTPFVEDQKILQTIQDDRYLHTRGLYYLLHRVLTVASLTPLSRDASWYNLRKFSYRRNLRGKTLRFRGSLERITPLKLYGQNAKQRDWQGKSVWEAWINMRGHPYLAIVHEIPPQLKVGDDVAVSGFFFKIWVYRRRDGAGDIDAPVFIGKTLQILHPKIQEGPKTLAWITFVLLFATGLAITVAALRENKQQRNFYQRFHQRRRRNLQNKLTKTRHG